MENAKKFFEETIKTEEAKAILSAIEKPATEEERVAAYLDIAKKLNAELTAEGILAYFADEKPAYGEIDDDELAQLTGGGDICRNTYKSGEFCWWNDGCDKVINTYDNYVSDLDIYKIGQDKGNKCSSSASVYEVYKL